MKAASMIGFIAGLLIIALVVLANAEASTRSYSYGDREPFTVEYCETEGEKPWRVTPIDCRGAGVP